MYTQPVIHILVQKRVNVYWLFWDLSCVSSRPPKVCVINIFFFKSFHEVLTDALLGSPSFFVPPVQPLQSSKKGFLCILALHKDWHSDKCPNPWKISSARAKNNLYGKYLPNSISHPESWDEMVMMMRRRNFMFGLQLLQTFSEPAEWRRICMCKLFLNEQGDVDIKLEY